MFSLFVELASTRLCNNGYVSFIIPSIILNNLSYQKIRDLLLNNHRITKVCYTGGNVFTDATVDTTILVLNNNNTGKIELIDSRDFLNPTTSAVDIDYFKKYNNTISIGSGSNDNICDKAFNPNYETIGDNFKVFQGIVTGNNEAFTFENESDALNNGIDRELLHPFVLGRDITKWGIKNYDRRILYIDANTDISKYPNTEKWLSGFKESLLHTKDNNTPWYSLHRSRDKNDLDVKEKILLQNTRNEALKTRIVATLDDSSIYSLQGCNFIIPLESKYSLYFLIGLLNSKYINYLFSKKFLNLAIKAEYIKSIQFPRSSKTIESLSKTMLTKNKELQELSTKFINMLKGDFKDVIINNTLTNWYELEWNGFTDALKKQKIVLSGTLKDDWFDRYNRFANEIKAINTIINDTDKQIDAAVYKLYNLTNAEIKVIEEQV